MKIVSFHNGNLNPDIIKYQRLVFEHFGYQVEQVETGLPHGEAIDEYLKKPFDKIAIFDIDCIPLNNDWHRRAFDGKVYAAAQQANHIKGTGVYASPAFMCFDTFIYNALKHPSFKAHAKGDVGSMVTIQLEKLGKHPDLLWPIHVKVPKWDLGVNSCFGLGTTYGTRLIKERIHKPEVYHAFESRMGNGQMFIDKCKEVLSGN